MSNCDYYLEFNPTKNGIFRSQAHRDELAQVREHHRESNLTLLDECNDEGDLI